MYVAGCTEVEVKSTEEAFEVFWKGKCHNNSLVPAQVFFFFNVHNTFIPKHRSLFFIIRTKEKANSQHSTQPRVQPLPQCVHSQTCSGASGRRWGSHPAGAFLHRCHTLLTSNYKIMNCNFECLGLFSFLNCRTRAR